MNRSDTHFPTLTPDLVRQHISMARSTPNAIRRQIAAKIAAIKARIPRKTT